ncbi:MAG: amidohydrolase [Acidobacteria bacterium]|nr:amidohydrolase [Acidobacteriota bacterium]
MAERPKMVFTGGGWTRSEEPAGKRRARVIDAHYHIFPRLGSQKEGLDPAMRLRFWQFHLRDWLVFWRKRDGARIEQRLLEFHSNNIQDMPEVNFRFGNYGQAEFTLDGVDYVVQLYPPSLVNMEAPPERMIAEMNLAGVDAGVIQADHVYGDLGEYVGNARKRYPGRFIGLGQVWEPEADRPEQWLRLERAVREHGHQGLYFSVEPFSVMQVDRSLDDPRFEGLWAKVLELQIPIFWFIDDRTADRAPRFLRRLGELDRWAARHPGITSVITHGLVPAAIIHDLGFPGQLMTVMQRPNMHAEILFPAKWPEFPYPEGQEQLRFLRDELGAGKLLWGSDSPYGMTNWCTYRQSLDFIRVHCDFLSQEEKDLILGGNAERLFRLDS